MRLDRQKVSGTADQLYKTGIGKMRKNRKIAAAVGAVLLILITMIAAAAIRNGHYLDELFIEKDPSRLPYLNVCYSDELVSAE